MNRTRWAESNKPTKTNREVMVIQDVRKYHGPRVMDWYHPTHTGLTSKGIETSLKISERPRNHGASKLERSANTTKTWRTADNCLIRIMLVMSRLKSGSFTIFFLTRNQAMAMIANKTVKKINGKNTDAVMVLEQDKHCPEAGKDSRGQISQLTASSSYPFEHFPPLRQFSHGTHSTTK